MIDPLLDSILNPGQSCIDKTEYEPLAPLSKKEMKEWDRLSSEYEKAQSKIAEIEARKQLFWCRIERKLKVFNKDLKIDGGMVFCEIEKKSNCGHQGENKPVNGLCDGNCEECALNPDAAEHLDSINDTDEDEDDLPFKESKI